MLRHYVAVSGQKCFQNFLELRFTATLIPPKNTAKRKILLLTQKIFHPVYIFLINNDIQLSWVLFLLWLTLHRKQAYMITTRKEFKRLWIFYSNKLNYPLVFTIIFYILFYKLIKCINFLASFANFRYWLVDFVLNISRKFWNMINTW